MSIPTGQNLVADAQEVLAYSHAKPSDIFGPRYRDYEGRVNYPHPPTHPFLFMSRITQLDNCERGVLRIGATACCEYDIPEDVWYFRENGYPTMPFSVLLEVALQTVTVFGGPILEGADGPESHFKPGEDVFLRNLDGDFLQHREVVPGTSTLQTQVTLTNISKIPGVLLLSFEIEVSSEQGRVFSVKTGFGMFNQQTLSNQVGLRVSEEQRALLSQSSDFPVVELRRRPEKYCAENPRLAKRNLLMLDRVTGFWPDSGSQGLGLLRAEKDVNPAEWFFKAHFYRDPVMPGSLGLESLLQLLQFFMIEQGLGQKLNHPHFEPILLNQEMVYQYRGQVIPTAHKVTVIADILSVTDGDHGRSPEVFADAWLWVDEKCIYYAKKFGMRLVEEETQYA